MVGLEILLSQAALLALALTVLRMILSSCCAEDDHRAAPLSRRQQHLLDKKVGTGALRIFQQLLLNQVLASDALHASWIWIGQSVFFRDCDGGLASNCHHFRWTGRLGGGIPLLGWVWMEGGSSESCRMGRESPGFSSKSPRLSFL